jgi:hypothetical protein
MCECLPILLQWRRYDLHDIMHLEGRELTLDSQVKFSVDPEWIVDIVFLK